MPVLRCARAVVQAFNRVIVDQDGPANLLVVLDRVNMDDLKAVLKHRGIDLIVATGGPARLHASITGTVLGISPQIEIARWGKSVSEVRENCAGCGK
ncbi:hypothetical protein CEB3_c08610 [Peptococcaceae bacterium CEB3]|nr:hypothetical protein CEB3_c08610 [Peptococcaceae bacterium CEB3]